MRERQLVHLPESEDPYAPLCVWVHTANERGRSWTYSEDPGAVARAQGDQRWAEIEEARLADSPLGRRLSEICKGGA